MTDELDTLDDRDRGDEDEAREAGNGESDLEEPRGDQPWAKTSSGDADSM